MKMMADGVSTVAGMKVCLLLMLMLLSTALPGAQSAICSGRGYYDENKVCNCFSGYAGADCSETLCPYGKAWVDFPTATDTAHAMAECSNAGLCNRNTGQCQCRSMFEGAACERLRCPSSTDTPCNGHGKCRSMRQAAAGWDGRALVYPVVSYADVWDADKLQGCVCDEGWEGYDCTLRTCLRGDNPYTTGEQNEVLRLKCKGDAGFFSLTVEGYTTAPIHYQGGFRVIEQALEVLPVVDDVTVSMDSDHVCSSSGTGTTTTIEYTRNSGRKNAIRADSTVSNRFGTYSDLALTGGTPTLQLITRFTFRCPVCATCSGSIFFEYDGELSARLDHNASASAIQSALSAMSIFTTDSVYGNLTVSASSNTTGSLFCSKTEKGETVIDLVGTYGNVHNLTIVHNTRHNTGVKANITAITPFGTHDNAECSDWGVCNRSSGMCDCFFDTKGDTQAKFVSSDGKGSAGLVSDCGFAKHPATGCPDECNGQGTCDNSTFRCTCFDGFQGPNCSEKICPSGKAWFDEPYAANTAHALAECSNMGHCNRGTGLCECRTGFTGSACQFMDCERGVDGSPCNSRGRCLPMYRWAELAQSDGVDAPFTYGQNIATEHLYWDAESVYGCVCDVRDTSQPYAGPYETVSGKEVTNPQLPGYQGYACQERRCPTGDNPLTDGRSEIQQIDCSGAATAFNLTFRSQKTSALATTVNSTEMKAALQNLTTIGKVTVNGTSCATTGFHVTFTTELGDLPLMKSHNDVAITEKKSGTKENTECSGLGVCDRSTGVCDCKFGYVTSDGNNALGTRGDCGYLSPDP